MNEPIDALERARQHLATRVAACERDGEVQLPTIRALAAHAGVGQSSMYKAVAELRARCVLTTAQGRSIRLLRLTTVQRGAVDFLLSLAQGYRRDGTQRLPTVAELASLARVSLATMAKAVTYVKQAGVVSTTSGSGIYVRGAAVAAEPTPPVQAEPKAAEPARAPRWEQVERLVSHDLMSGVFAAGRPLPAPKELCARYGVCHRTLQKALSSLERRERIVRDRARFVAVEPEATAGRNTIILIARGTPEGELFRLSARTITNLRWLETECSRHGLRLVIVTHNDMRTVLLGPIHRQVSFAEALRRENVLGFVVWTMGLSGPEFGLDSLLLQIAQHRRPVSILDEGEGVRPVVRTMNAPVKVFTTGGGPDHGRRMARYLLDLGHRRVAWISPMGSSQWSRERLVGLRGEFLGSGAPDGVVEFCSDVARRVGRRAVREQATTWDMERLVTSLSAQAGGATAEVAARRTLRALETQLWMARVNQELGERCEPLFDRAIADPLVSAWVGANDEVAVHALDYLQEAGRRVPEQISVAGFDNSNESTIRGLSTYNFNIAGIAHGLVSHVLDPKMDPWDARRDPPVEIEGFVTERVTTSRARQA